MLKSFVTGSHGMNLAPSSSSSMDTKANSAVAKGEFDAKDFASNRVTLHVDFEGTIDDFKNNPDARRWRISNSPQAWEFLQYTDHAGKKYDDLSVAFVHKAYIYDVRSTLPQAIGVNMSQVVGKQGTKSGRRFAAIVHPGVSTSRVEVIRRVKTNVNKVHARLLGLSAQSVNDSIISASPPGATNPFIEVLKGTELCDTIVKPKNIKEHLAFQQARNQQLISQGKAPLPVVVPYVVHPQYPTINANPEYVDFCRQQVLKRIEREQRDPQRYFTNLFQLEFELEKIHGKWENILEDRSISTLMPMVKEHTCTTLHQISFAVDLKYSICDLKAAAAAPAVAPVSAMHNPY